MYSRVNVDADLKIARYELIIIIMLIFRICSLKNERVFNVRCIKLAVSYKMKYCN